MDYNYGIIKIPLNLTNGVNSKWNELNRLT